MSIRNLLASHPANRAKRALATVKLHRSVLLDARSLGRDKAGIRG
jgi:hypothetical protein